MQPFAFSAPGRFLFGAGRVSLLPDCVAELGSRPFVCVGSRPDRHAGLLASLPGEARVFAVSQEPTLELVRAAVAAARDHDSDVVVGLGGGSVIDMAKIVAALVTNEGDALDYLEVIGRGRPLVEPCLPVIAVPTTAGTGSEMTANGVVSSAEHGVKVSLRSQSMIPRVAIVDPELTLGTTSAVTAASGVDALTQCLEAFVTPLANPLTDGLAREGLRLAGRSLRRAHNDGSDLGARSDMALCASLSGLALANAKLGVVHGFAGPIGGMIAAPHGDVCAALLVAACETNQAALADRAGGSEALRRYAEAGELLAGDSRVPLTTWLRDLVVGLGCGGLVSLGFDAERIPDAVEKAKASSSIKGNPIRLMDEELAGILQASL